jgi:hypothetical protein
MIYQKQKYQGLYIFSVISSGSEVSINHTNVKAFCDYVFFNQNYKNETIMVRNLITRSPLEAVLSRKTLFLHVIRLFSPENYVFRKSDNR